MGGISLARGKAVNLQDQSVDSIKKEMLLLGEKASTE